MAKTLVIGGAKPGIGQAIVTRSLEDGYDVVATIDPEYSDESSAFRDANSQVEWVELVHADVRSVREFLDKMDGIDTVSVAHFYFYMEPADQFDDTEWTNSLGANLTLVKSVGHASARWGNCKAVTVVTSTEAFMGSFGAHAYAATKAAVHNLVKSLANTSRAGVRFNAVAAGWIGGVMDTDEVFNMSRQITPLKRLGSPEEVAAAVRFLNSDEASFVNGATLVVDGGYSGVDTISKYEFETEYGAS